MFFSTVTILVVFQPYEEYLELVELAKDALKRLHHLTILEMEFLMVKIKNKTSNGLINLVSGPYCFTIL